VVSNDPGPGVLPLCNFISSGVDKIDFGIAAQYNLILSFIKHRDIPLPWRGVRVPALHTDGVVISCTGTRWSVFLFEYGLLTIAVNFSCELPSSKKNLPIFTEA